MDIEEQQSKPKNDISILKLIMSFRLLLQEESNEYYSAIKFIYEQINLMRLISFFSSCNVWKHVQWKKKFSDHAISVITARGVK